MKVNYTLPKIFAVLPFFASLRTPNALLDGANLSTSNCHTLNSAGTRLRYAVQNHRSSRRLAADASLVLGDDGCGLRPICFLAWIAIFAAQAAYQEHSSFDHPGSGARPS